MDCRTCQPSLIDLLHGELALEAAEQARAHIAHCANCKGALDKLAQGLKHAQQLPLIDPPQAVTARLLQMADEQARRALAARKPRGAPTMWQGLLDFVGRFAAARQVGMVTIMLLIVAVGLWSLPQLKHTPIAAGGTVVHPDESGEAAPSTGVEPAQPLDLKVDLRARRIRSREEAAAAAAEPAAVAPAAPVAQSAAESIPADDRAARGRSAGGLGKDSAYAEGSGVGNARLRQARKPSAAAAPSAFPRNVDAKKSSGAALDEDALAALQPSPAPEAERRAAPAAAPAPARASAREIDELLDGALQGTGTRASAGPPPAKSALTAEASSSSAPGAAALAAARATAAARGCSAALPDYERIVRASPGSATAGEALIEMARCAQSRGDAQGARALLARAAQIPQVARRASDMLARLPTTEAKAKGKVTADMEAAPSPSGIEK